jgi:benzoyl-CoA 2,3-dioxygenase component A
LTQRNDAAAPDDAVCDPGASPRQGERSGYNNVALFLFFGSRRQDELPYCGPLMKLPKSLIDVELAFSREPGKPKQYVQDRLRARADDVARLLKHPDAFFYICGHKRMESGVNMALAEICAANGMDWEALLRELREAGRFHVETYF